MLVSGLVWWIRRNAREVILDQTFLIPFDIFSLVTKTLKTRRAISGDFEAASIGFIYSCGWRGDFRPFKADDAGRNFGHFGLRQSQMLHAHRKIVRFKYAYYHKSRFQTTYVI